VYSETGCGGTLRKFYEKETDFFLLFSTDILWRLKKFRRRLNGLIRRFFCFHKFEWHCVIFVRVPVPLKKDKPDSVVFGHAGMGQLFYFHTVGQQVWRLIRLKKNR
jgi:hypothetical protein